MTELASELFSDDEELHQRISWKWKSEYQLEMQQIKSQSFSN
jgi:hypothetical protein